MSYKSSSHFVLLVQLGPSLKQPSLETDSLPSLNYRTLLDISKHLCHRLRCEAVLYTILLCSGLKELLFYVSPTLTVLSRHETESINIKRARFHAHIRKVSYKALHASSALATPNNNTTYIKHLKTSLNCLQTF